MCVGVVGQLLQQQHCSGSAVPGASPPPSQISPLSDSSSLACTLPQCLEPMSACAASPPASSRQSRSWAGRLRPPAPPPRHQQPRPGTWTGWRALCSCCWAKRIAAATCGTARRQGLGRLPDQGSGRDMHDCALPGFMKTQQSGQLLQHARLRIARAGKKVLSHGSQCNIKDCDARSGRHVIESGRLSRRVPDCMTPGVGDAPG